MTNCQHEDVFDRIMKLPILRMFITPYKKYKGVLLYLFFGGVSLLINIALFVGLNSLQIDELISNVICWIVCVFFQFFTNRTWVFDGHVDTKGEFWKQMISFISGRLFTLFVEEMLLLVFVKWLLFNATITKIMAQIITIVLNYIYSKLVVFRRGTK